MEVDCREAESVFQALPPHRRNPYLHPAYIITDAARDVSLRPTFFVYTEGDKKFYHGFHLGDAPDGLHDIQSAYGYGGPAASHDDGEFLTRAWASYRDWSRNRNVLAEFLRFHPLLANWRGYSGQTLANRQTVWIDLTAADLAGEYRTLTRRQIKTALKAGLTCGPWEKDAFLAVFPQLYNSLMLELGADSFYIFPAQYHQAMIRWDKARCLVCHRGGELLAAGIYLMDGDTCEYHLGASTPQGRKMGAMYLLMHEAACLAQSSGCKRLNLGGGTDAREDNPLLFFKTGFSRQRGEFIVGRQIYRQADYNALRNRWQARCGQISERTLFYRF